ncbi:MAG TPA: DMT family transporter [Candidatus Limnocylindrales bacterium]|nr:DMT family transporter [Candidatus Limnocylindrales bacterium]
MLAAACWAGGTVASKQAVAEIPPLTLLAIQLAGSVALLLVVARVRGERLAAGGDGRKLARLGLLNPGLAYALSLVGLAEISASVAVLLWAMEPILILALAALVLKEHVTPPVMVASIAAVGGLSLVVAEPAAGGSALGILLTVAGVAVCAVYTVAARRWLPGASDSTLGVVAGQQVHALALAIVVVAIAGVAGGTVLPATLSPVGLAAALGSGLLYYAFAYLFYLSALRTTRASLAASSFYLIPVMGVALASLAGERLEPLQWVGGAIVVGAVALITAFGIRASDVGATSQPPSAAASAQMATTPSDASRS